MKNIFVVALGLWASISTALPTGTSPNDANVVVRDLEARARPACGRARVDKYLFKTSIKSFLAAKKNGLKNKGPKCGWKSNGCTGAPDRIPFVKFNFKPACDRHDFGYGNYKRLNLRKESHRKTIDKQFLKDMVTECNKYGLIKRTACRLAAAEYYKFVRGLGWIFNRDVEDVSETNNWARDEVVEERDSDDASLFERSEDDADGNDEDDDDEVSASEEEIAKFMEEFGITLD